jgi:hypothetical protein
VNIVWLSAVLDHHDRREVLVAYDRGSMDPVYGSPSIYEIGDPLTFRMIGKDVMRGLLPQLPEPEKAKYLLVLHSKNLWYVTETLDEAMSLANVIVQLGEKT